MRQQPSTPACETSLPGPDSLRRAHLEGTGALVEPIVSAIVEDPRNAWQWDIASLLTRHALGQARTEVVRWLL
jgi:hypothetical protein